MEVKVLKNDQEISIICELILNLKVVKLIGLWIRQFMTVN